MQEKLSIKKVYKNAGVYMVRHFPAFIFLVVLYYVGNLLPMIIGINSFKIIAIPSFFLFLYIAAGCYYKEKLLLDRKIFISAVLRFLTVALFFLAAMLICSFILNLILDVIRRAFMGGEAVVFMMLHSVAGLIVKYLFEFMLFISFFVIPAFAFISEISGKSRSFLTAYAKTKGNVIRISLICAIDYVMLMLIIGICVLLRMNTFVVEIFRVFVLIFIMITYFKMYDFFYKIPQKKTSDTEIKQDTLIKDEDVKLADEAETSEPQNDIV